MWGFAFLLRNSGTDMGFTWLVMWACGALYISSLVVDTSSIGMGGLLSMLSPSLRAMIVFGASGARPVFSYGRWWTVLSASWLHGGLLHIAFNMMSARDLLPVVAHLYGAARTVIIYVVAGVVGFAASSIAGHYLFFLPRVLRGAGYTLGASAAIFGLIGALAYYGRRGGSALISDAAKRMALGGLVFGFVMPGVDNWAHLGGFVGGYLVAKLLDPLLPERGDHFLVALVCLVLSLAAVVVSFVTALPALRPA
jgi:rhomboid protease GluP